MIRVFVGVDPGDSWRAWHARLSRDWRQQLVGVKAAWVDAPQVHLTIRFVGNLAGERVPALGGALREAVADVPRFDLAPTTCGCFPLHGTPTVAWVGFRADPLLKRLHGAVTDVLSSFDVPPEDRPYTPHVTVMRLRPQRNTAGLVHDVVNQADVRDAPPLPVDAVVVFESRISASGAVYRSLSTASLR